MDRISLKLVREPVPEVDYEPRIKGPSDIHKLCKHLGHLDEPQEVFMAFFLNARHVVVDYAEVTRGILDASLISPREVFQRAFVCNAKAVILAHNHPSGDVVPSAEDRQVTKSFIAAGRLLDIQVLDHVIVTVNGYHSIILDL